MQFVVLGGGKNEDIHKPRIRVPGHGCRRNFFAQQISRPCFARQGCKCMQAHFGLALFSL